MITSTRKGAAELIPWANAAFGFADPAGYLPEQVQERLDQAFRSQEPHYWLF